KPRPRREGSGEGLRRPSPDRLRVTGLPVVDERLRYPDPPVAPDEVRGRTAGGVVGVVAEVRVDERPGVAPVGGSGGYAEVPTRAGGCRPDLTEVLGVHRGRPDDPPVVPGRRDRAVR